MFLLSDVEYSCLPGSVDSVRIRKNLDLVQIKLMGGGGGGGGEIPVPPPCIHPLNQMHTFCFSHVLQPEFGGEFKSSCLELSHHFHDVIEFFAKEFNGCSSESPRCAGRVSPCQIPFNWMHTVLSAGNFGKETCSLEEH